MRERENVHFSGANSVLTIYCYYKDIIYEFEFNPIFEPFAKAAATLPPKLSHQVALSPSGFSSFTEGNRKLSPFKVNVGRLKTKQLL